MRERKRTRRSRKAYSTRREVASTWDDIDAMIDETARDLGIKAQPSGLNADWSVEAWHLSPGRPNTTSGDYYLLDTEDGSLELVRRFYEEDSPGVEVIDRVPATEKDARKILQMAQRLVKSASRFARTVNRTRRRSSSSRRASRFQPGDRVRVNDTSWSGEPGRPAQMAGLTGTVISGPTTTRAGTYYDVELHASDEEIAAQSMMDLKQIRQQNGVFQFEPAQLDPN